MSARMRGLLIFAGSLVVGLGAYWLVFHVLSKQTATILQYPLALPLVGMLIGALELITGVPIQHLDEGWQKLPGYVQTPVALVGGVLFLWGLVKVLGF
jgi:ABC-type branched-subunit amino acid transport system permease subunit